MAELSTKMLPPGEVAQAADMLRAGKLVAFATETVYGLGANAANGAAVARVYGAKGRPSFNPLIVHVASLDAAEAIAHVDDAARVLARAFWPGPLSLVLPLKDGHGLSSLVTAGLDTVAIRIPAHPLARALLGAAACPVAAPSANPSGQISPTTAAHVMDGLGGRIDAVLDGGACDVGLESTIVATNPPRLLRPGGLPLEAIEAAIGALPQDLNPSAPSAPGQLTSHYAPNAALTLNQTDAPLLLGFGEVQGTRTLSASGDVLEAAANLFARLREMDALAGPEGQFAVAPIPMTGLGLAINDRLTRAAAPRP